MGWTGWFNRPFLWLVVALIAALVGVGLAREAVQAFSRPADPAGVPHCGRDFADDCLTTRNALPEERVYRRSEFSTSIQTWQLIVQGDWPRVATEPRLELQFRSQAGRDELRAGAWVEVVFVGSEPIWVRLPSGAVLETTEHPWQAVPADGFLALTSLGGAMWSFQIAARSARLRRSWFRAGPAVVDPGVGLVVFGIGALGLLLQFGYPRPSLLGVAGLVLIGWIGGLVVWRRLRPDERDRAVSAVRFLDRRRRAGLMSELEQLAGTGLLGDEDRRNGHLALVIRPSAPLRWQLDPDRVAAAAERALATRGWADFAPDLTADGWIRADDGVRLTRGLGGGRVWEDGLLEVTVRADGVILLVCGRGTSYVTEAWPRLDGRDPAQDVPVVLPALLLGLTAVALLLAAELAGDDPPDEWSAGVRIDRLRGAVARELLLVGADPVPLERDHYVLTKHVSGAALPGAAHGISLAMVRRLLRELGVDDQYG